MKILLALGQPDAQEIISFLLESRYGAEVALARPGSDGHWDPGTVLATLPDASLIICEYPMPACELLPELAKASRKIPVILCAASLSKKVNDLQYPSILGVVDLGSIATSLNTVIDTFRDVVGEERAASATDPHADLSGERVSGSDDEFTRINTSLLLRVCPLKADIYIRLSQQKYLKYFREGDMFDLADHQRITERKKINYLWLRKDDCFQFAAKFRADLLALLGSSAADPEAGARVSEAVHETVTELLNQLGPTEEVQQMVKTSVQHSVKMMAKAPRLKQMLEEFTRNKEKYIASHSMLLTKVACALAAAMEWHSDMTLTKLSLAAFLHDITMKNQELAMIHTLDELELKKELFTEEEIKQYKLHPIRAADLCSQFGEIPADIELIIRQHHELPDGSGFPQKLSHSRIGPLSSLFIVAHDIVRFIFAAEGDFNLREFLAQTEESYCAGHFKKLHRCLSEARSDLI